MAISELSRAYVELCSENRWKSRGEEKEKLDLTPFFASS
jgi:hypothetical protein